MAALFFGGEYWSFHNLDTSGKRISFLQKAEQMCRSPAGIQTGDTAYRIRTYRHKAYYSLDYGDNIEREMIHHVPSVQEIKEQNMEEENFYVALDQLPAKQRKRVYAHYILGIKQLDIANMKGTSVSTVHESIQRGLRCLKKIIKKVCKKT